MPPSTIITFEALRPTTKPYSFEENWDAAGEALSLENLRELSARRREALEASTSTRSSEERLEALISYAKLVGKFHSQVFSVALIWPIFPPPARRNTRRWSRRDAPAPVAIAQAKKPASAGMFRTRDTSFAWASPLSTSADARETRLFKLPVQGEFAMVLCVYGHELQRAVADVLQAAQREGPVPSGASIIGAVKRAHSLVLCRPCTRSNGELWCRLTPQTTSRMLVICFSPRGLPGPPLAPACCPRGPPARGVGPPAPLRRRIPVPPGARATARCRQGRTPILLILEPHPGTGVLSGGLILALPRHLRVGGPSPGPRRRPEALGQTGGPRARAGAAATQLWCNHRAIITE